MTMVLVMSIGTGLSPSTANVGRRPGKRPSRTITSTPPRKASAAFLPSFVAVSFAEARSASTGPRPPSEPHPPAAPSDDAVLALRRPRATGRALR